VNSLVSLAPPRKAPPKELAVISGKGGTGKTSLVASFAALAGRAVLADCDVDAADLHLLLAPRIIQTEAFSGGKCATILPSECTSCGKCIELCRFDAIHACPSGLASSHGTLYVDPLGCEGCGVCAWFCPEHAIHFGPVINGEWFISETRFAPMVHAKLGIAEQNSGKLVSVVRSNARRIAAERDLDLVLIDGSPGIGCPVIASITGADLVLVVTEPTLSGLHDLERVVDLTRHFGIPTMVCVNKWDLNPQIAKQIEAHAVQHDLLVAGRIRYDDAITRAQVQRQTVVEYQEHGCAEDIRSVWEQIAATLTGGGSQLTAAANSVAEESAE
jgi:MinD superfamily P-loop ATPase